MTQISARWVLQVLTDRGVPRPPLEQIDRHIASLTHEGVGRLHHSLRRIQLGLDEGDEIDQLLGALRVPVVPVQEAASDAVHLIEFDGLTPETTLPTPPPQNSVVQWWNNIEAAQSAPSQASNHDAHAWPASTHRAPERNAAADRPGVHIYGGRAALKVELDQTRALANGRAAYTVLLEIAQKRDDRHFDWEHKLAFQITVRELPRLASRLMGYCRKPLRLAGHGSAGDKHFELLDQGRHLFVRMGQGKKTLMLPVESADVAAWASIAVQAMRLNSPQMGEATCLGILKRVGQMESEVESTGARGGSGT